MLQFLLYFLLFLLFLKSLAVPLIYNEVIVGNTAELTCDLRSSVPGDYVLLVLWYKDGETLPFYR